MQLSNFIGLKLVDIGTHEDTETLVLEFTGGHCIHIKHDDIKRATILSKPKETSDELEERRAEIKKAKAEARAEKVAKVSTPAKKPSTTAKKSTKKKTI